MFSSSFAALSVHFLLAFISFIYSIFIKYTEKMHTKKWTWESANGETRNETDFIITGNTGTVADVIARNNLKCGGHRMSSSKVLCLNLRKERVKLIIKKHAKPSTVKEKTN